MSISSDTSRENLTLSEAELAACKPIVGEGSHVLRALCPFHGSDRQRSLRVQVHSGRFVCFACGAWGYMEAARGYSGVRSSSARRPSQDLQPAGIARHTVASRHLHFPGSKRQPSGRAPQLPPHRVRLPRRGLTWPSSSRPSRPPCPAAVGKPTCSSGAFPSPWRSS